MYLDRIWLEQKMLFTEQLNMGIMIAFVSWYKEKINFYKQVH